MPSFAVKFEHVTKRYPRGWSDDGSPRYASLRTDLSSLRRRTRRRTGTLALEDVSFEVPEGESFALVGPNGAGKSTALKLISRISYPTTGTVRTRGRVAALMEVGSGVHPELTGRENVRLYGQILGFSAADVRRRFDEIVDFAEIGPAIDTPVKFFSSGMQLRLGFSIAAHLEPDIFVVDEALAVGDAGFQAKCVDKMTKLVAEGHTLLFVSHNLSAVEAVCQGGIFLNEGRVAASSSARDAIRSYLDWVDSSQQARLGRDWSSIDSTFLRLDGFACIDDVGLERFAFRTGESISLRLSFHAFESLRRPHVSIGITDGRPGSLILCSMLVDGGAPERVEGDFNVDCNVDSMPLLPRVYEVWASVRSEMAFGDLYDWQRVGAFRITDPPTLGGPAAASHTSLDAPIYVDHSWEVL
jgi:ABC-type polysaccharide/polyol phosphate transport system ATPase subunit